MIMALFYDIVIRHIDNHCFVPCCYYIKGSKAAVDRELSFHTFNDANKDKWLSLIGRELDECREDTQYCICSNHFTPDDYELPVGRTYKILKLSAVPSRNIKPLSVDKSETLKKKKLSQFIKSIHNYSCRDSATRRCRSANFDTNWEERLLNSNSRPTKRVRRLQRADKSLKRALNMADHKSSNSKENTDLSP